MDLLEINLSIIAAVLTIVGYSMNDTVVIYDRVRENLSKYHKLEISDIAKEEIHRQDKSNNQPIFKSINFIENLSNLESIVKRVDVFAKQILNNNKTLVSAESVEVGEWIYNGVFGICLIEEKLEGKFSNQQRLKISNLGFFNNNEKCLRTESYSKVILVR